MVGPGGNFVAETGFTNGMIQAGIHATVAGGIAAATGQGSFGQAFTGSLITSAAAAGANWIGSEFKLDGVDANPVGHAIAHAILGCASGHATNRDCASGAIGGVTSAVLSNFLPTSYEVDPLTGRPTLSATLTNALTAGTATLVGGLVANALGHNGVVGANTAANEIQNNRLLHPKEIDAIRAMASRLAGTEGLSAEQWEARLAAQAMRQVSWANDGMEDSQARSMLERMVGQVGPLQDADGRYTVRAFYATPGQKLDDSLYGSTEVTNSEFYRRALTTSTYGVPSGVRTPEQDAAWRQFAGTLTVGGAAVSLSLVGVGLAPAAVTWILGNPVAAGQMGLISVEAAACISSGAICPSSVVTGMSATAQAAANQARTAAQNSRPLLVNGKPVLALGLDEGGVTLELFASRAGGSTWRQWEQHNIVTELPRGNFGVAFTEAAENAGQMQFNLDGFDIGRALTSRSTNFDIPRNATIAEFNSIIGNSSWLNKTVFYSNGVPLSLAEFRAIMARYGR